MRAFPFLMALFAICASAQTTSLTLIVRDDETGSPLPGARLEVAGLVGATDQLGRAELVGMDPVPLQIVAAFPGYVPLDTTLAIIEGVSNVAVLSLRSDAVLLGNVLVVEETINNAVLRRRGFFERREKQTGVFLTRAEIDQRGATLFSDVFQAVPGVRVQREGGVTSLVSARRLGCPLAIFLDGVEAAYLARAVDAVPFRDVAAVEVYRGPSEVPIEYTQTRSSETCGAVLVWTRILVND